MDEMVMWTRPEWNHDDKIFFAKFAVAALVIFYLNIWFLEAHGVGWRRAHSTLWKKPKRWQLITACILWTGIIAVFVVAFLR